jgi:hypothetical protein
MADESRSSAPPSRPMPNGYGRMRTPRNCSGPSTPLCWRSSRGRHKRETPSACSEHAEGWTQRRAGQQGQDENKHSCGLRRDGGEPREDQQRGCRRTFDAPSPDLLSHLDQLTGRTRSSRRQPAGHFPSAAPDAPSKPAKQSSHGGQLAYHSGDTAGSMAGFAPNARRKLAQPGPTSRGLLRVGVHRQIVYRDSLRPDDSLPTAPPGRLFRKVSARPRGSPAS